MDRVTAMRVFADVAASGAEVVVGRSEARARLKRFVRLMPQLLAQQVGQTADHLIADRMTITVIDLFKMVNVQHHHTQLFASTFSTLQFVG